MTNDRKLKIATMYPLEKALDEKTVNPFMFYILRPISFDISILLAKKNICPINITWASLILLIFSSFLFLWEPVMAAVFFILYQFLDVIDGNVARLNHETSSFGEFLDETVNAIAGFLVPVSVGMYLLFSIDDFGRYFAFLAFSIGIMRLFRRTISDKVNTLLRISDRENVARAASGNIKFLATLINALMIPSLLLFLVAGVLNWWILLYFAYNFSLTSFTFVWACKRIKINV
jgi:phosphatidylglycerophosphate synthase